MAKKYYSLEGEEAVHPRERFLPNCNEVLFEHQIDKSTERWCIEHQEIISEGDCGKICNEYEPINKVKGKCRWSTWCCSETGKRFTVVDSKFIELTDQF